MKKFLRILLIALTLLALTAVLAGPKVIGVFTEDIYRPLIADQQNPSLQLHLREFQPGWFASRALIDVQLTSADAQQRLETLFGQGTRLLIEDQIAHGPLPLANGLGAPGLVRGLLTLKVLPGGGNAKDLLNLDYRLAFDGAFNGTLNSPRLQVTSYSGGELLIDPLEAEFTTSADGRQLEVSGQFGLVRDAGAAVLELQPGSFELRGNSNGWQLNASAQGLRYDDSYQGFIDLQDVQLVTQLVRDAQLMDLDLQLNAGSLSGAFDATDFSTRLRAERIDRAASQAAGQRMRRQLANSSLNPVAVISGAILGELPNFLAPQPGLQLGPVRANVGGQQLAIDGRLTVIDGAVASSPLYAWRSLDGQLAANLPHPVAEWLTRVLGLRAGVAGMVDNGVLMPAASGQYLLDLSLLSGIVTLNGRQFEPDVGRMMR